MPDVVEGDLGVDPGEVLLGALESVVDDVDGEAVALLVHALVELAAEELDAHDGEDEPEHQAHEKHVEDGGDGVHQGVHHDLKGIRKKEQKMRTDSPFYYIPTK